MSGGNGIPRYALWNRENEFAPLKHRGIVFRNLDPLELSSASAFTFLLTPDQVLRNIVVTGSGGSTLRYPTVASVLQSPSGLLAQYFNTPGAEWSVQITNFSSGILNFDNLGPGWLNSSSFVFLTAIFPNETKTLNFRVISPTQIYVY